MFLLDSVFLSCLIMALAYFFIITDRMNQAVVALLGACLAIFIGLLSQEQAIDAIDFNTIFLLIGMMMIVLIMKRSGIFQFLAIMSARLSRGNPRALLIILSGVTAVLSGFLDNVTTVMLTVPIVLLLTEQLKIKAYPFLIAQVFFSNIGGTATLIGDPPNILIGSAVGLSFMEFIYNTAPVVLVILVVMAFIFDFIWGRHMKASLRSRAAILRNDPYEALEDIPLLIKSLGVLILVILGFVFGHALFHLQTGTTALAGASLLLLLDSFGLTRSERNARVQKTFEHVEWETIFFFIGLFIIVAGMEQAGVLSELAQSLIAMTNADFSNMAMAILWGSAIISAFLNNIPFVATMIPLIENMEGQFGGAEAIKPLWWALSLGACLGGNGSIVGASANVLVAVYAARSNQPISFVQFMITAMPLMLISIVISTVYIWFRYL